LRIQEPGLQGWPAWATLTQASPSRRGSGPSSAGSGSGGRGGDEQPALVLPAGLDVVVVDDAAGLEGCAQALGGEAAVGVDAEWPPGSSGPATVLQLAGKDTVCVLDLPALGKCCPDLLVDVVGGLLADSAIKKVGYGFGRADLPRLAGTYSRVGTGSSTSFLFYLELLQS
jgi:hypothetical protein